METLEVLIEENAFGAVRPVEVSAEAPVGALVPALVAELKLPQTDLFGNRLVYILRQSAGGQVLPEDTSLQEAGIYPGTKLALDSYVVDGSVATLMREEQPRPQASFYSSQTIGDSDAFASLPLQTSGRVAAVSVSPLPPAFQPQQAFQTPQAFQPQPPLQTSGFAPPVRKKRRWTRRALIGMGGVALAAGSVGLAYASYRSLFSNMMAAKPKPTGVVHPGSTQAGGGMQQTMTAPTMAKSMLVFSQHQQTVRAVHWSPDGNMLVSGANDRKVLIWDLNGKVHITKQEPNIVHTVSWSPDGQLIAAGSVNQVIFIDAMKGMTKARDAHTHQANVTAVAWSPKQQPLRLVSASLDMQAVIWDGATFQPLVTFKGHNTAIEAAGWAADGRTVATSSHGGAIRVWNSTDAQEVHEFFMDGAVPMNTLAFAPAGTQLVVGGNDGKVRLWNGLTCQMPGQANGNQCMDVPQRIAASNNPLRVVAWSPDGRFLATAGDDGKVLIWYPAQSQTPIVTITQNAPVLALSWSPSGRQIATASGNNVTIWGLS